LHSEPGGPHNEGGSEQRLLLEPLGTLKGRKPKKRDQSFCDRAVKKIPPLGEQWTSLSGKKEIKGMSEQGSGQEGAIQKEEEERPKNMFRKLCVAAMGNTPSERISWGLAAVQGRCEYQT